MVERRPSNQLWRTGIRRLDAGWNALCGRWRPAQHRRRWPATLLYLLTLALWISGMTARGAADWFEIDTYPSYPMHTATVSTGDVATVIFPKYDATGSWPAFLVWQPSGVINLSNATVGISLSLDCVTNSQFWFGGKNSFNSGTMPPSTRFFFSTVTGYSNTGPETNYWFCHLPWLSITNNLGATGMIVHVTSPGVWSDGQGQCDTNAFWAAAANVKQVGICFGGGSFYDIGVACTNAPATLHIPTFNVSPNLDSPANLNVSGAAVTLAWNPSTNDPDFLEGYKIYRGPASHAYTNEVFVGSGTNVTISNLLPGSTNYFAATAVATNGVESFFSNEAVYVVPTNIPPASPPTYLITLQSSTNLLTWTNVNSIFWRVQITPQ
jgi:hypothetical protein